jgi:hypothetical protein
MISRAMRIALGPVITVAGNQPHAIAVALQAQPIAVVLDFVKPIRCVPRRDAKSNDLKPTPSQRLEGNGGESLVTPQTKCELHRGTII